MDIVGHCPDCGAPIYADLRALEDGKIPKNKYSCECREKEDRPMIVINPSPPAYYIPYVPPIVINPPPPPEPPGTSPWINPPWQPTWSGGTGLVGPDNTTSGNITLNSNNYNVF